MPRLIVAAPGPLAARAGAVRLADKTVSGLRAYSQRWDGDVVLAAESAGNSVGSANLGARWYQVSDLPFDVSIAPTLPEAVTSTRADLIMANLTGRVGELEDVIDRCVLLAEFDPWLQSKETWPGIGAGGRARALAGAVRRTRDYRRYVARARGLQCNGIPAHRALAQYNDASMLFFDSRLGADDVEAAASRERPDRPDRPARVAFSGRLHRDKGADYLIGVADQMQHLGVELDVFGDGELREHLERESGPNVRFHGSVDYVTEWLPYMRTNVDLMILPHTQSDPSCTYLEAIGLGVPVLGFDNAALQSLVDRFDIGWTVPMRDGYALASKANELLGSPHLIAAARHAGFAMMREHHADATFDARVTHVQALV